MKSVNIAWVFAGLTAVSMGMAAEACSSSSSNGSNSSSSTTTSSSSSSTTTGTSSSTTSTIADAGPDCHKAPPKLHPEDGGAGVYCPFSAADGGKDISCAIGEHCCEPTTDGILSVCSPAATACTGGATDWVCEGTPDCAGTPGTVCCGTGVINTQAACGSVPAYSYVSGFKGSSCAATCPDFQICSKDSECPGGATGSCQSIEPKGNGIGYCTGSGGGSGTSSSSASSSTESSSGTSSSASSTASSSSSASDAGS